VKKPQWITIGIAFILVFFIYRFGSTVQAKPSLAETGHVQATASSALTDTILNIARRQINPALAKQVSDLEKGISSEVPGKDRLSAYHRLAHFWKDSAHIFPPYGWYEAEAARLENSENSLTFAARLFLENLQQEGDAELKRWEALQAKDLFERSLNINPGNDSTKIELGATLFLGEISPMEGVAKIREVLSKDSANVYGQIMMVKGLLMSSQYDKAITRLETITRVAPTNVEAPLMLADIYERMNDKENAIRWYQRSLQVIERKDVKEEIAKRIEELKKAH
jgi:tetratricopeptide (TPR) repeat protein